jgi:inner membrane protein
MSTIGHPIVALAITRSLADSVPTRRRSALCMFLVLLSIIPDVDLILPAVGLPAELTLGHRAVTHSFLATVVVALLTWIGASAVHWPRLQMTLIAWVTILSHPLLDALSPGPGIMWLWPLSSERFSVWPVLPIADLAHPLSPQGLLSLAIEFLVFSPLLLFAVWPSIRSRLPSARPGSFDDRA